PRARGRPPAVIDSLQEAPPRQGGPAPPPSGTAHFPGTGGDAAPWPAGPGAAGVRRGMDPRPQPREAYSRPGEPTTAPPGSPRKIRVLMERAARREPLFHPLDNCKRRPPTPEGLPPEDAEAELAPAGAGP